MSETKATPKMPPGGSAPPNTVPTTTPALVSNTAELLRAAGFPAWGQSLAGVVGGVLLVQGIGLSLFFFLGLYSVWNLHPHRLHRLTNTFLVGNGIALMSFITGVLLAIAARRMIRILEAGAVGARVERIQETVTPSESPVLDDKAAKRAMNASGFPRWFDAAATAISLLSIGAGGSICLYYIYILRWILTQRRFTLMEEARVVGVSLLTATMLILGGIPLFKAAGAVWKMRDRAKEAL